MQDEKKNFHLLDILPKAYLHHCRDMFEKLKFIRIGPADVAAVLRVQERAYLPFFHENAESFVSKMKLSPATCYGVLNEGRLVAYGISFPWFKSQGVDLNSTLTENSVKPDIMYIHDISVDPDYRGLGLGEALFKKIFEDTLSKGLNELALVAVQGSKTFWSRFGFTITDSEVKGYGADAVTMVLKL